MAAVSSLGGRGRRVSLVYSSLLKAITLCSLNVAVSTTFLKSDYSLPL